MGAVFIINDHVFKNLLSNKDDNSFYMIKDKKVKIVTNVQSIIKESDKDFFNSAWGKYEFPIYIFGENYNCNDLENNFSPYKKGMIGIIDTKLTNLENVKN